MSTEQQPEKKMMESTPHFKSNTDSTDGKNIESFGKVTDCYDKMNQDNKNMLEKVKSASTNNEIIDILMSDPVTGRRMSYAESRMRFG